jgi:regulatory protein
LRKKLFDRGYTPSDLEQLLADLTASRLIDDRRVAAAHVRTATGIKGRGRLRVARELKARGIPKALIDEALGAVETQDETAALKKILVRKKWPARPTPAEHRRMFQHLMRRGFPVDAIVRALGRGAGADWDED